MIENLLKLFSYEIKLLRDMHERLDRNSNIISCCHLVP